MAGSGVVVIGLDPGSVVTGWGVVREVSGTAQLLDVGVIRTSPQADMAERLGRIFQGVDDVVERLQPQEAALENVFAGKNPASALKLGQARGAAIAACARHGLPVHGYEPTSVKKMLVGVGRAEKSQVAFMVAQVLGVKGACWPLDASDALAVAICHLNMRRMLRLTGGLGQFKAGR